MKLLFKYTTAVGVFHVGQSKDGRFHPVYDGESYGSYSQPDHVAEALAGNNTFSIVAGKLGSGGCVLDTSIFHIPESVSEWEAVTQ